MHDIQIAADRDSEAYIIKKIMRAFPRHAIHAEESGDRSGQSDYQWIVDPLDGTINYSRGIEEYCISLALFYKKQPLLGLVYQPALKKLFHAQKGMGTFLNDEPIHVSRESYLISSLIATDNSSDPIQRAANLKLLRRSALAVRHTRIMGSTALHLARIACGSLDCYFRTAYNLYDVGAGILLVQEAGGRVTTLDGSPLMHARNGFLATNGKVHAEMIRLLAKKIITG